MRRPRLYLATLILLAGAAATVGLLLAPAPEVDALPPNFRCTAERTTASAAGSGPTCTAALQAAETAAAALVPCAETCSEVFEVTQECIGVVICNGSCHTRFDAAGRMRYRCRLDF